MLGAVFGGGFVFQEVVGAELDVAVVAGGANDYASAEELADERQRADAAEADRLRGRDFGDQPGQAGERHAPVVLAQQSRAAGGKG